MDPFTSKINEIIICRGMKEDIWNNYSQINKVLLVAGGQIRDRNEKKKKNSVTYY